MIRIEHLSKTFAVGTANEVRALKNVSLTIESGEYLVVIGSNGSGKSTLLNCIAGSQFPDAGKIFIDQQEVSTLQDFQRSKFIARIFQNPLQGTAPDLTLLENFRLAALRNANRGLSIGTNKVFTDEVKSHVATLGMNLENKVQQTMGTLSGGQRQALTLLMAVMSDCSILLLDEPTAALDPRSAEIVLSTAEKLIQQHKLAAILITHSMKDALRFGQRLVVMQEGSVVADLNMAQKEKLQVADLLCWF
jgi:putative ABC transport system ATP-binding protein